MLNVTYICSKCESFQKNEKKASCARGMWQNVTLKDALLYTPWDFECLNFHKIPQALVTLLQTRKEKEKRGK